jgi:hypothetical protein
MSGKDKRRLRRQLMKQHPGATLGTMALAVLAAAVVSSVLGALLPSSVMSVVFPAVLGLAVTWWARRFERRYVDPAIARVERHTSEL